MEMLALKNGSSEPKIAVVSMTMSLKGLWNKGIEGMCAVSDLYERCQNPRHPIASAEMKTLRSLSLIQPDGRVHTTVKNVVLSAITGKGYDIKMGSPVKPEAAHSSQGEFDNKRIAQKTQGIAGLAMVFIRAVDTFSVEDLTVFCDNTPDGEVLWRAFTAQRDAPSAKEGYNFMDYIREVVAKHKG